MQFNLSWVWTELGNIIDQLILIKSHNYPLGVLAILSSYRSYVDSYESKNQNTEGTLRMFSNGSKYV